MSQAAVDQMMKSDPSVRRQVKRIRLSNKIAVEGVKDIRLETMSRLGVVASDLHLLANRRCPACEKAHHTDCRALCPKCAGLMATAALAIGHIVGQAALKGKEILADVTKKRNK